MASVKGHAYILCITLLPLLLFAYKAWGISTGGPAGRFSTIWTSFWLIVYVIILKAIVVPFYSSPLRHLPQPDGDYFALGHGLVLDTQPPGEGISKAIKHTPNDGMILLSSFFLIESVIVLTSPAALIEVLQTKAYDYTKHKAARQFLTPIIGNGLVIAEGSQHKMHRKAVTPAFHGQHINGLIPLFWQKSLEFVDTIAREMTVVGSGEQVTGTIEISAVASRVTLDIIGVASLGKDFNTLQNPDNDLVEDYSRIMDPSNKHIGLHAVVSYVLTRRLSRYIMPKTDQLVTSTSLRLRRTCDQLVAEKRSAMEDDPTGHVDILSILLKNGSLTDDELVDQLLTFLAAGHETTATALTWAAYELSRHPDIQEKLRAEIRDNEDISNGRNVSVDTLDSLPYLNAVCIETLRLWATVPLTSRVAYHDTTILGVKVAKGTTVVIAPCVINKSRDYWGHDCEQFVPERWLREDGNLYGGSKSPYNMMTFLHGPRSCIGQGFAKNELKCLVAAMVDKFDIAPADPAKEVVAAGYITIKPKDGLLLRLRVL